MFVTLMFFLLVAGSLGMENTGPSLSPDCFNSLLDKEMERMAAVEKISQPLFVNTFLGKREEVQNILGGFPEYLPALLDCNSSFKCPLETAIMRGHFEIANLLLAHMKIHIPHKCIEDLFVRWNMPMIHSMITRDDKEAVKYIFDTIIKENPEGPGINTKFFGMTALHYAKSMKKHEMILYLTELGCRDESIGFAFDDFPDSKKDSPRKAKTDGALTSSGSPRKAKTDGALTSSGSPRKSTSGNLPPPTKSSSTKRRLSSPRLHIDLHFRSRSSSLTTSSSPRKPSTQSPRTEKASSDAESQGIDDLDGSSRVESDTGGSSSSTDSVVIKKNHSGSLLSRSKHSKK